MQMHAVLRWPTLSISGTSPSGGTSSRSVGLSGRGSDRPALRARRPGHTLFRGVAVTAGSVSAALPGRRPSALAGSRHDRSRIRLARRGARPRSRARPRPAARVGRRRGRRAGRRQHPAARGDGSVARRHRARHARRPHARGGGQRARLLHPVGGEAAPLRAGARRHRRRRARRGGHRADGRGVRCDQAGERHRPTAEPDGQRGGDPHGEPGARVHPRGAHRADPRGTQRVRRPRPRGRRGRRRVRAAPRRPQPRARPPHALGGHAARLGRRRGGRLCAGVRGARDAGDPRGHGRDARVRWP